MAPLDGVSTADQPLGGLSSLADKPTARVLLTDSPDAGAALERLAPANAVAWIEGRDVDANLTPLRGRKILVWSEYPYADYWRHPGPHALLRRLLAVAESVLLFAPTDTDDAVKPQLMLERERPAQLPQWILSRCRPADELSVRPVDQPPLAAAQPTVNDQSEPATTTLSDWEIAQADAQAAVDAEVGESAPRRRARKSEPLPDTYPAVELPAPLDLFSKLPLPVLKPHHLPVTLGRYVFDQSEIIGSDPGILAISALVTCAACIHDGVKLQARRRDASWRESARLWGAIVGDPSVKKSPAVSRAVSHAKKIDMEWRKESAAAAAQYAIDLKIHKASERKFIADRAAGRQAGTPHKPPEQPSLRRLIAEDATVEALGVVLKDNPRGVLVVQDELSGWFGAMDAYKAGGAGGKDRALWLEAYNGGPKAIDRITRESIIVPNWSVSMCGGIQPSAIRSIVSKLPEDGLLQRFMLVLATEQPGIGEDRAADQHAVDEYRWCLDWLAMTQPTDRPITLSDDAAAVFEAAQAELKLIRSHAGQSPRLNAHIAKWDGLFARLCLTYHCIDSAAQRLQTPAPVVSGATASAVWRFIHEYLWPHALAVYALLEDTDRWEHARWIAGYVLARKSQELANRDILRAYRCWGSLSEWQRLDTMRILEDAGWLFPGPSDAPGRRTTYWAVNPRALDAYADIAERETARRAEARERIAQSVMMRRLMREADTPNPSA